MKVILGVRSTGGVAVWRWPEWATERLQSAFPDITFVEYAHAASEPPPDKAAAAVFADADAVVAWQLHPELVKAAKKLQWVHSPAAAVHQLLSPELIASPVVVTNGVSVHAATVAEHTLALLLALARNVPQMVRQQERVRWDINAWPDTVADVQDATVVMVGTGHIGRATAPALAALGARVIGVRRQPAEGVLPAGFAEVRTIAELPALLPQADFLILAVPETPETRGLIGAAELALLPTTARLISMGRGSVLDEAALAEALRSNRLAGAALDVFAREPLPEDSPLWACERLLVSPHVGASTQHSWERQVACLIGHLRRFQAGEPLSPLVDKRRGY